MRRLTTATRSDGRPHFNQLKVEAGVVKFCSHNCSLKADWTERHNTAGVAVPCLIGQLHFAGCDKRADRGIVVSRREELPKNVAFQRLDVALAGSPDEPFAPLVTPCIHGNPPNGAVQLSRLQRRIPFPRPHERGLFQNELVEDFSAG